MAAILKTKLKWSGFAGAPGYTNLFWRAVAGDPNQSVADSAASKTSDLGSYLRAMLPIEASLQVQSDVEVLDETTGEMQTVLSVAAKPVLQGTAPSAPYSAASGAVITWRTAGVRRGRRVRGRTFVVPIANSNYQSDGTLATATITTLNTNLATWLVPSGAANFGIWARPTSKDATDGIFHQTTGFTVPDMVAILRSRRD